MTGKKVLSSVALEFRKEAVEKKLRIELLFAQAGARRRRHCCGPARWCLTC